MDIAGRDEDGEGEKKNEICWIAANGVVIVAVVFAY